MRLVTSRPTLVYEAFEQRVPFPTQIKICYCDLRQYLRYLYGALGYTSYVNKKNKSHRPRQTEDIAGNGTKTEFFQNPV